MTQKDIVAETRLELARCPNKTVEQIRQEWERNMSRGSLGAPIPEGNMADIREVATLLQRQLKNGTVIDASILSETIEVLNISIMALHIEMGILLSRIKELEESQHE